MAAAGAAAGDDEAETPHVRARGDVGSEMISRFAALAEAAWPQWKAHFGVEPPRRRLPLALDVRATREGFLAAVHAAGGPASLPGAGGYYDPHSRTSFLYLQPHVSSTRLLVLHELTHQYQYKALQDDVPDRSPIWHKEGLAEHFGSHRLVAGGVETGALDVVAIDARPQECADRVRAGTFDPWAVGTGGVAAPDYVDSLALVETFLRTKDDGLRDAYRAWEREMYAGGNALAKFERAFRGKEARLRAAASEVWGGFRRTWTVTYVAWDEEPGAIVGRGMPWALLRGSATLPAGSASVEAVVSLSPGAAAGGVALAVRGADDLVSAEVRAPGRVVLRRKRAGVWTELAGADVPGAESRPLALRLRLRGTTLSVDVDGAPQLSVEAGAAGLASAELAGTAALCAESGEVRFAKTTAGG